MSDAAFRVDVRAPAWAALVGAVAVVVVGFAVVYIAEIERSRGSRLGTEVGVDVGDRQSRSVVLTGEP